MRSLLFIPGDDERKLAKAQDSGADVVIIDLEDSVAPARKQAARAIAADFMAQWPAAAKQAPRLHVRVNSFDSGLLPADLDAVLAPALAGLVLPKAASGEDLRRLDALLDQHVQVRKSAALGIVAIATETASSLFGLASYREASPRLVALTWGSEDLAADLGAEANRGEDGRHTGPFALARQLCLFAAGHAEVAAIDGVYPDYRNLEGLRREAGEAVRDGFSGKLAIHPQQVSIINEVFTPSPQAVAEAAEIVALFEDESRLGVVGWRGQMLDRPHLKRAQRTLARARLAG